MGLCSICLAKRLLRLRLRRSRLSCRDDPLKPEVRVTTMYDQVRELRSLRVSRTHHGNQKVSVLDEEFQLTADYQQLMNTALNV